MQPIFPCISVARTLAELKPILVQPIFSCICCQDISIGTWQLQHTAGEQETTFKFHRSLVVKAGKAVTVSHAVYSSFSLSFLKYFLYCPIICTNFRGTAPAPHPYLQQHPGLILHCSPALIMFSTGGDIRSSVVCHPKETLHCH